MGRQKAWPGGCAALGSSNIEKHRKREGGCELGYRERRERLWERLPHRSANEQKCQIERVLLHYAVDGRLRGAYDDNSDRERRRERKGTNESIDPEMERKIDRARKQAVGVVRPDVTLIIFLRKRERDYQREKGEREKGRLPLIENERDLHRRRNWEWAKTFG